jgi:hypothetical protein
MSNTRVVQTLIQRSYIAVLWESVEKTHFQAKRLTLYTCLQEAVGSKPGRLRYCLIESFWLLSSYSPEYVLEGITKHDPNSSVFPG